MTKTAVVLFNLGAPDKLSSVRPFLYNLFNDPAIISLPWPVRPLLALFISRRRTKTAQEIYAHLGGGSPLLQNTKNQADALEKELRKQGDYKVFISMRYWHPFSKQTVGEVKEWGADSVLLVPLYPQFSTTTTGSSFKDWEEEARRQGLDLPTKKFCCYPVLEGFVDQTVVDLNTFIEKEQERGFRILFTAHGLPKKIVNGGDSYQYQVEKTAEKITSHLISGPYESVVCYQSKVGPLEWIGPSTESEIERAGRDQKGVVLVPLSFVSEHSETLVELDIEYKDLAEKAGVPFYIRRHTVSDSPLFINDLASKILLQKNRVEKVGSLCSKYKCSENFSRCPLTNL